MFALVHFIIAAEAGETAKAATTAAAINILIWTSHLKRKPAILLVNEVRIFHGERFGKKIIFHCSRDDRACQIKRKARARMMIRRIAAASRARAAG
jgi:hypothetical protein